MLVKLDADGQPVGPYSLGDLRRDNPNTSFPADLGTLSAEDLASFGVIDARDLAQADDLPAGVLDAMKAERLGDLAAVRYERETGGIVLNGAAIATDRQSQGLVNGALALVTADPSKTIDWKAAGGWIRLDAQIIQAVAFAVGSHVQACFSRERELAEQIEAAADLEALDAVDIAAGWPGGDA